MAVAKEEAKEEEENITEMREREGRNRDFSSPPSHF